MLDPENHTCFWCCQWKSRLFVCDVCREEKRMSNYHFLLCGRCLALHSANHEHPRACIWSKREMDRFVEATGSATPFS